MNAIFDLDGTLLDTSEGILESARYSIRKMGFRELTQQELLTFIGPPLQASYRRLFGCDEETAQRATDCFRECYRGGAMFRARPYDGIYALCDTLKARGVNMAVATYKKEDYALAVLKRFRFDEYCRVMHGADGNNKLTKEDIITMCVNELGGDKSACAVIGDTENDAKGAQKAGVSFIGVTYGFGFRTAEDVNVYPNIGTAGSPEEVADIIAG